MSALTVNRSLNAMIVALGVALALGLGLRAFGLTALVDYTDSMRPAIAAGDVVVDETVPARELRAGQIVSLEDTTGRLITHRAVSVTPQGSNVVIVTRGDANDSTERWVLAGDEPAKRMVHRVPWVGHVMAWLGHPNLRSLLMLLAAAGFFLYGIRCLVGRR